MGNDHRPPPQVWLIAGFNGAKKCVHVDVKDATRQSPTFLDDLARECEAMCEVFRFTRGAPRPETHRYSPLRFARGEIAHERS
jgi:hypothetical protein